MGQANKHEPMPEAQEAQSEIVKGCAALISFILDKGPEGLTDGDRTHLLALKTAIELKLAPTFTIIPVDDSIQ